MDVEADIPDFSTALVCPVVDPCAAGRRRRGGRDRCGPEVDRGDGGWPARSPSDGNDDELDEEGSPDRPRAFWTEYRAEISAEDLVDLVVPIYVKYLTLDDMQQLAAFYESPLGKILLEVQPAIVQDSMSAGQEWGRDLARRVIQRLKDRGYAPKANTD